MTITLAIANLKGGVGKSTTTLMLAEGFALLNKRVLVVDLDAQSNASYMLASKQKVLQIAKGSNHISAYIEALAAAETPLNFSNYVTQHVSDLRELVQTQTGRIDLISAVPRLRFSEFEFERAYVSKHGRMDADAYLSALLLKNIRSLATTSRYDVTLIDCSPAFSVLTRAALLAADRIISPTIPDFLSVVGLADFTTFGLRDSLGIERKPHAVVVTKYRKSDEQMVREDERLRQKFNVLGPRIPTSAHIVRATEHARTGQLRLLREKYRGGLHVELEKLAADVWQWLQEGRSNG